MKKILIIFSLLLFSITTVSSSFNPVLLSNGVGFELPKNWIIFSDNTRTTLEAGVESRFPLYKISTDLPFAANLYNDYGKTIGIMNIRIYPSGINVSQTDVKNFSDYEIRIIDDELKKNIKIAMKNINTKLISWEGSRKQFVNGKWLIITKYSRTSVVDKSIFKVTLARVLDRHKSFTLTTSFDESQEILLAPITNKIINSLESK
tara:strand:+ start:179 stop:793 length:615 start_codon:yes stop_codon:yes gene_type:complete